MDNILEILIPLIFAAIYFFGNMFGKSKDGEDASPGSPRRRAAEDEDADAIERQRRIQDEIRRKIMERRRSSEGETSPVAPVAPSGQELRERRREARGQHTTREAQKETREVMRGNRESPPPLFRPTHHAESEVDTGAFSWDESDNAYESGMQAQLKRIEETKLKAEKLKKQAAAQRRNQIDEKDKPKRRSGGYFTGSVKESLQNPAAARVAFVYGEVLGQPVSLRKGQSVPGLN